MYGGGRGGGSGRQVCPFFLQGRCRFGDNCKNEHPQGQGNSNGNRFAPLQNQDGGRGRAGQAGSDDNTFGINADDIKKDLSSERPIWPLSCYAPGKNAPAQLIEGEVEQSPEEMRVMYYITVAGGNAQEAAAQEAQASAKVNEAVEQILNDLSGAVKYVVDAKNKHPNRLDLLDDKSNGQAAPSSSPFGQPSAAGQQSSPFGKPAAPGFGQPSAFGQSSALGKAAAPGFGQPSSMGGGATSAFGQPSGMGGGAPSAFGQPSGLGQGSGFGQPAQMGQKSAFGQPAQMGALGGGSPFGQQAQNKPNPFASSGGQPNGFAQAGQQQTSGFGQPSTFGAATKSASPFATAGQNQSQPNPFGANNANGQAQSPFAPQTQPPQQQSSPFGQQPAAPAFGQTSQPAAASGFGQPTQPGNVAFGQTSQANAFGQTSQPAAFGQNNTQQPKPSPFGQGPQQQQRASPFAQPNNPVASPFAQPTAQQPTPNTAAAPHAGPDPSTYLQVNPATQKPTVFKSQPVRFDAATDTYLYRSPQDSSKEEQLWFPTGPPVKANPHAELDEVFYTGELGKALEGIYKGVLESGRFGGSGEMPEIPPRGAWVGFDI